MHTIALVIVAPLVQLVLLFLPAAIGAGWLAKKLPEGRLKRILFFRI